MNHSHITSLDFWFKLVSHRTSLQASTIKNSSSYRVKFPSSVIVTKKCSFWEARLISPHQLRAIL